MVSWKYGQMSAEKVVEDMGMNHGRPMSTKLVRSVTSSVEHAVADKEFELEYELPELGDVVSHVSIGRDGTTTAIRKEGYRETMCGTISLYNSQGDRLHTIYSACAPEYGKKTFNQVLSMEIEGVKKKFPAITYLGLADGAKDNWTYLQAYTDVDILDFYHACEHLAKVSAAVKQGEPQRKEWLDAACHDLKHSKKGARHLLRELKQLYANQKKTAPEVLPQTITYFENNLGRMDYCHYQKKGYPIGSGVTEAACKTIVKQRLSQSGMRWNIYPAQGMLLTRGLVCTNGRWEQFWNNYANDKAF